MTSWPLKCSCTSTRARTQLRRSPADIYCELHGGILPDGTVVGMSGHVTVLPAKSGD